MKAIVEFTDGNQIIYDSFIGKNLPTITGSIDEVMDPSQNLLTIEYHTYIGKESPHSVRVEYYRMVPDPENRSMKRRKFYAVIEHPVGNVRRFWVEQS